MKFNLKNKGQITQGFYGNATDVYKKDGRRGHGAIDYYIGHGLPVKIDNGGFVYKHYDPFTTDTNWTGVYILTPTEDKDVFVEVCIGHFIENKVKTGDNVVAGQVVGLQGNYGIVFSGNRQITVAEQKAGSKAGSHVHESWRPVRRIRKTQRGKHYLQRADGNPYRDADKHYYEIIHQDNGYKGYVDPITYSKGVPIKDIGAIEKELRIKLQQTINLLQTKILTLKKEKGLV